MNKQFSRIATLSAAIGLVLSSGAIADTNVAGQTVGYQVSEIALISVSGNPADGQRNESLVPCTRIRCRS
jgi:hypothetical protein